MRFKLGCEPVPSWVLCQGVLREAMILCSLADNMERSSGAVRLTQGTCTAQACQPLGQYEPLDKVLTKLAMLP